MKVCRKCNRPGEFHKSSRAKDGLQAWCKRCSGRSSRQHYRENKERHWSLTRAYRRRNQEAVYEYLLTHPCVDCGEADPVVLDFDHVRGVKVMAVSVMAATGASLARLFAEIKKCRVRCANCHRRRTAKQFRHHRQLWTGS